MASTRWLWVALASLMALGATSPAFAWTRTVVHSADATVDVEEDASMAVLLRLEVEVHAGWLHELEFAGLGSEVELDRRRPPYLRSEDGEVYRPEATITEEGRIRLTFERRGAPRKGEYRVMVRYRVQGDARRIGDGNAARLSWTLPAWETGLHDVTVDIRAPKGASAPIEMQNLGPGLDLSVTDRPQTTQLVWRRVHLPRQTPWTLVFDVPADAIAIAAPPQAAPTPPGFQPLRVTDQRSFPWALAVLACLALLKRRAIEVTVGRPSLLARIPWPIALGGSIAAVGLGGWLPQGGALCALPLVLIALQRKPRITATRRSRLSDLLDATTAPGLVILVALFVSLLAAGQPLAAVIVIPLFFTGTRHHRGPERTECEAGLREFVAQLRLPWNSPQIGFSWQRDADGAARCRLVLPRERAGLLSLSLVSTARATGGVSRRGIMLLVETRAQSDADDLVRRRIGVEPDFRDAGGRVGRLIEWDSDAICIVRALGCPTPTEPVRASRGSWLVRQVAAREAA